MRVLRRLRPASRRRLHERGEAAATEKSALGVEPFESSLMEAIVDDSSGPWGENKKSCPQLFAEA